MSRLLPDVYARVDPWLRHRVKEQALKDAICSGNPEVVRTVLGHGDEADGPHSVVYQAFQAREETRKKVALGAASRADETAALDADLFARNAFRVCQEIDPHGVFIAACRAGAVDLATEALPGIDINQRWNGTTALHIVVENGSSDVVENGSSDLVRRLLAAGADVAAVEDDYDKTVLQTFAFNSERYTTVEVCGIADLLFRYGASLVKDELSLYYAIVNEDLPLAEFFIARGANLNPKGMDLNPLWKAVEDDLPKICELLVKNGALTDVERDGQSPFDFARERGCKEVLAALHWGSREQLVLWHRGLQDARSRAVAGERDAPGWE